MLVAADRLGGAGTCKLEGKVGTFLGRSVGDLLIEGSSGVCPAFTAAEICSPVSLRCLEDICLFAIDTRR